MNTSHDFDAWTTRARSVTIEDELARRGITLRGKNERCGPCPICGGDDRFSINIAKQVFNCRGCGKGGDVIDLVQLLDGVDFVAAGTTLAGEPPPKANGNAHSTSTAEPRKVRAGQYTYRDENGATLFVVGRFEYQNPDGSFVLKNGKRRKTFKQVQPDPENPGKWLPNVDGVRVVPYRLPGLIEAIGSEHIIFVVEGEHKVNSLAQWGVPATCNSGGAGKWKPEHSAFLRGADVVILPDNDSAGRSHAQAVAESLKDIASRIRVVPLPDLEEKGDVVDWQARGHTREELDALVEAAPDWQPGEADANADDFAEQANTEAGDDSRPLLEPTIFQLRPASEITSRPRLYGSHYVRKFISSTMARTSTGKTALLVVETLSMVSTRALLTHAPKDPLAVWYLGEDPIDELERRITAACQYYGIAATELGDRLHVDSMRSDAFKNLKFARQGPRGSTVIDTAALDLVAAGIMRRKVDILQLDPLIKFHTLPESDNTAMDLLMQALCDLAERTNVALEIGHHLRKPGSGNTGPATMDDGRGASAIISAARTVRILNPMTPSEATKAAIPEGDRWRYLRQDTAPLGKANLSPPEATQWLQHASEILPCGESVGVIKTWKFPDPFEGVTTADMHLARSLARSGEYRADSQARNWFGKPLAQQLRLDITDPAARQKIKVLIKTWLRNKALDIETRKDPNARHEFDFIVPGPFADSERADATPQGGLDDPENS